MQLFWSIRSHGIKAPNMKNSIIILALSLVPFILQGQVGDGSSANPFRGDISTSVTWSTGMFTNNTIYIGTQSIPDLRVTSNGHLTIEEDLTIIFTRTNSNLIVTGSGILTVVGKAGNPVLFTKHPDNNNWGHVSFETPGSGTPITGTGFFKYAIFEYGYAATSGTLPSNAGGAIQVNAKDVIIENCIFRFNYSNFGGAVTVNAGSDRNTIIRNSYFFENTANQAGGAILTWTGSTPVIENCVFEANHCNATGPAIYSGGAIWALQNTSKVVNSAFINNTSPKAGDAIYSYGSSNMRIVNCVFWGSDDQIAGNTTSSTVNYSAIQGSGPMPFTNSFWLNASNTAINGPNFSDPSNSDWRLTFNSPLRDSGANSFTGVTIPSNDYEGNSRIYIKDIGAFEYQYSRWKTDAGSTDWNTGANWEGSLIPTTSVDIVIPSGATNYPTGMAQPNVTISAGKLFIMEPGSRATVGNLTNGGTLQLRANSASFSSMILNSYSRAGSGTEEIDLYLSGGGSEENDDFKWHYISSPVTSLSTNTFTAITPDLAQFVESRPVFSLRQGWVAYDGYVYSTGQMNGPTFNTLTTTTNGKGYNYFDYSDHLFTFSGVLNTSTVTAPLGFSGNASLHGFNLLGNPFISGLDWNYIVNDPGYPTNTSKGLYFTRDNIQCSYINGVGVPGDVTGIIPPMQGFFTKTYSTGNSIVMPTAARTHDNIHPRYKGGDQVIPLVRLALQGQDITDETVVRFDHEAKKGWDNDFDAAKLFYSESRTFIYSLTDTIKYSINGQPFPDSVFYIPLVVNLINDGNHTISTTQLQGLENYKVRLVDQQTNTSRELSTTPSYTFTAPKGITANRFMLKISTLAYTAETLPADRKYFNIYQSLENIYITPISNLWDGKSGSVEIVDLSGRIIQSIGSIVFSEGSLITIDAPKQKGVYFVNLKSGILSYTAKVMVR